MKNLGIQNIIDIQNHKIIGLINPNLVLELLIKLKDYDNDSHFISIESLIFDRKIIIYSLQEKPSFKCEVESEVNDNYDFLEKNQNISSYKKSKNGYEFIFNGMPEELLSLIQADLPILESSNVSILNYRNAVEIFFAVIKRNNWFTAVPTGIFLVSICVLIAYEVFHLDNLKSISWANLTYIEVIFLVLIAVSLVLLHLFKKRRISMFSSKKSKLQLLYKILFYSAVICTFTLCLFTV